MVARTRPLATPDRGSCTGMPRSLLDRLNLPGMMHFNLLGGDVVSGSLLPGGQPHDLFSAWPSFVVYLSKNDNALLIE